MRTSSGHHSFLGRHRLAVTVATAIAVSLTSAGAASADTSTPSVEKIADLAQNVGPDLGLAVAAELTADGTLVANLDSASAQMSKDGEVTLESEGRDDLTVSLPNGVDVSEPKVADDGTVVYGATEHDGVSVAVRPLEGGQVSIQTVLPSPTSTHSFTYSVADGVEPVLREDGGLDLLSSNEGVSVLVGSVDAPWAFDAAGDAVTTSYTVSDHTFTQVIVASSATQYPVVADPTYGHSYGIPTIYLNKDETQSVTDTSDAAYMCVVAGLVIGAILAAICAGDTKVISNGAKAAVKNGKCVKLQVGPLVVSAPSYTGGNCK